MLESTVTGMGGGEVVFEERNQTTHRIFKIKFSINCGDFSILVVMNFGDAEIAPIHEGYIFTLSETLSICVFYKDHGGQHNGFFANGRILRMQRDLEDETYFPDQ